MLNHWVYIRRQGFAHTGCSAGSLPSAFPGVPQTRSPALVFFPTKNKFLLPHPIVPCMCVSLGRDHLSAVIRMNVLIETVLSLRPAAIFTCLCIPLAQPKVLVRARSKSVWLPNKWVFPFYSVEGRKGDVIRTGQQRQPPAPTSAKVNHGQSSGEWTQRSWRDVEKRSYGPRQGHNTAGYLNSD